MYRYKTADHFRQALREAVRDAGVTLAGPAELQSLAMRQRTSVEAPQPAPADKTPSSSYYDTISETAAAKRKGRESTQKESPEPSEQPHMNENVVVQVDLPCIHCRYNLRGVPISECCPECGAPIAESGRPDRLLFADQDWLRRVARGLRLAHLWPIVALPLVVLVSFLFTARFRESISKLIFTSVVFTLPPLIASIGGWLASAPEPAAIAGPNRERKRRQVRRSIALTWALAALAALSCLGIRWEFFRSAAASFFAISIVLAMISVWHSSTYLLRQAVREGGSGRVQRPSRLCVLVFIVPPIGIAAVTVAGPPSAWVDWWYQLTGFYWLILAFLFTMWLFRGHAVEFRQAVRDHVACPPILDHGRAADGSTGTNSAERVI